MKRHPEQQNDEIYLGNATLGEMRKSLWRTSRLGKQTFMRDGTPFKGESYPWFIKKSEVEQRIEIERQNGGPNIRIYSDMLRPDFDMLAPMSERPKIIQNAIKIDDKYLVSRHVHDYRDYEFENGDVIAIDGGLDYLKRVGNFDGRAKEFSLTSDCSIEEIREKLLWGCRGKDGRQPLTYKPIKDLDIDHLTALMDYCDNMDVSPIHKEVIEYWFNVKQA